MPTFRNDNLVTTQLGQVDVKAGKTVETYRYYTVSGVVKISDLPSFNPLIYEVDHNGDAAEIETVTIPDTKDKDYTITLQMLAGSAEVALNDTANTPVILLATDDKKSFVINGRLVDTLELKFKADSSILRIEVMYR